MNRLVHSDAGFLRALEISSDNFFVFVEGALDRSFMDRLVSKALTATYIRARSIAAKELPSDTGGKTRLLSFFRYARHRGKLAGTAFGKKYALAFFADKDVDDIRNMRLRSPHVLYTDTYDLEGHLYCCGDLVRAVADATGMTALQARGLLGDPNAWIGSHASNWLDWTVLCIISQVRTINIGCTFDRTSQINADFLGPVDQVQLSTFKARLQQILGINAHEFNNAYRRYRRRVSAAIVSGRPLVHFKGKWLSPILQRALETWQGRPPDTITNGAGDKVLVSLLAQVAVGAACPCCAPYVNRLEDITTRLH